jgi:hypothetical protein
VKLLCEAHSAGWDTVALRGGPALRKNPVSSLTALLTTDPRKRLRFTLTANAARDFTAGMISGSAVVGATIQARSNLDVFLGPAWSGRIDPMQYVAEADDGAGHSHYVLGTIHETTASLTARVNWALTSYLSLQVYAQPFVVSGRYSQLKDVDNPAAERFADRFHILQSNEYTISDGTVFVDHAGMYSFARPDFRLGQLRSNVVLRWEYRPGSTVFVLWSHGQTSTSDDGRFQLGRNLGDLIKASEDNLVMIKVNYWLGL